jgi:hypothetical protein
MNKSYNEDCPDDAQGNGTASNQVSMETFLNQCKTSHVHDLQVSSTEDGNEIYPHPSLQLKAPYEGHWQRGKGDVGEDVAC